MADWFLTGDDFAYLAEVAGQWLAYGIGLGAIAWVIGRAVALVWSVLRF